jgi:uncharacterized protein (UPF0210 family)
MKHCAVTPTILKLADSVGNKVAAATGWRYLGLDPTATALGDVSIAGAIEAFTGARFGSSGTLTAARIITTAEKGIPVRQVGYSGLMLPVLVRAAIDHGDLLQVRQVHVYVGDCG